MKMWTFKKMRGGCVHDPVDPHPLFKPLSFSVRNVLKHNQNTLFLLRQEARHCDLPASTELWILKSGQH